MAHLPKAWKPNVQMKRIHVHWTAGGHSANSTDKNAYHILIEGDGNVVRGDKSIANNAKGSGLKQASHTRMANTGAIGVSMCCMRQSRERPFDAGPSPMTEVQWNRMTEVVAELAHHYNILVTPTTILTHAEVQSNLGIRQKNKWDVVRLAFDLDPEGAEEVGERMRSEIAAHMDGTVPEIEHKDISVDHKLPKFRVTGVHPSTLNFRDAPNGNRIGSLPERTVVERLGVVDQWWRVRTRLGFVGWVFSGFLKPN
ncbi:MAG: N-acetylmuramoyl-L-alanine amidase [Aliishimia sp.]